LKYEYTVIKGDNTMETLNKYGAQGWVLVSFEHKLVIMMREYE
tara:strand:+ start:580 stop:708 length:129 start_codon:yes stop_codon:yes gene_type:complete